MIGLAHQNYQGARLSEELEAKFAAIKPTGAGPDKNGTPADPRALADLATWARQSLQLELTEENLHSMSTAEIRRAVMNALDAKERPEMREMEKAVLLQILDSSWMEHLRAMDHLRSSIGLQGYAQIDPKVEYKREGMRIFAEMWNGIGDRVTDLIFRVEQFDPEFLTYLGSQWKLDRARQFTIRPILSSPQAPRPMAFAVSKTRPSPVASGPPKKNANLSATLQKRSVATTLAPADRVKNSKPAACANNRWPTHSSRPTQSVLFCKSSHFRASVHDRNAGKCGAASC